MCKYLTKEIKLLSRRVARGDNEPSGSVQNAEERSFAILAHGAVRVYVCSTFQGMSMMKERR